MPALKYTRDTETILEMAASHPKHEIEITGGQTDGLVNEADAAEAILAGLIEKTGRFVFDRTVYKLTPKGVQAANVAALPQENWYANLANLLYKSPLFEISKNIEEYLRPLSDQELAEYDIAPGLLEKTRQSGNVVVFYVAFQKSYIEIDQTVKNIKDAKLQKLWDIAKRLRMESKRQFPANKEKVRGSALAIIKMWQLAENKASVRSIKSAADRYELLGEPRSKERENQIFDQGVGKMAFRLWEEDTLEAYYAIYKYWKQMGAAVRDSHSARLTKIFETLYRRDFDAIWNGPPRDGLPLRRDDYKPPMENWQGSWR